LPLLQKSKYTMCACFFSVKGDSLLYCALHSIIHLYGGVLCHTKSHIEMRY